MALQRRSALVATILGMAAAIFLLDTAMPLGVASGVLYVAVVLLAVRLPERGGAVLVACSCTVLIGLGAYLSPASGEMWKGVVNRGLAVVAVWTCLVMLLQRKKLKSELEVHNADLQIKNVQLQAYMAELERRNKDLDDFAHITSHDLKAPLHGIDRLAQWIVEDEGPALPASARRRLHTMQQRVRRVQQLMDDLRAYTRIGRGPGPTAQEVDTGALVRQVAELVVPAASTRVRVDAAMPSLLTDKGPLEQVFINLLDNAVKHGRPDGVIDVGACRWGEWVEFGVADDGPGVPPEYRLQIFGPFKTLKSRDEVEGSGMGLAIVRKIIEGYGGQIRLEDRSGGGARFVFTWPARGA